MLQVVRCLWQDVKGCRGGTFVRRTIVSAARKSEDTASSASSPLHYFEYTGERLLQENYVSGQAFHQHNSISQLCTRCERAAGVVRSSVGLLSPPPASPKTQRPLLLAPGDLAPPVDGVRFIQKMLKGHLPRVIYHQVN